MVDSQVSFFETRPGALYIHGRPKGEPQLFTFIITVNMREKPLFYWYRVTQKLAQFFVCLNFTKY